jgi:transcription termination factor 2
MLLKEFNETINVLKQCSSPNIIGMIKSRRMKWAGHVARMVEKRNACRILVGKSEGKRTLGRPRRRWMDNIKTDIERWDGLDRCGLG